MTPQLEYIPRELEDGPRVPISNTQHSGSESCIWHYVVPSFWLPIRLCYLPKVGIRMYSVSLPPYKASVLLRLPLLPSLIYIVVDLTLEQLIAFLNPIFRSMNPFHSVASWRHLLTYKVAQRQPATKRPYQYDISPHPFPYHRPESYITERFNGSLPFFADCIESGTTEVI